MKETPFLRPQTPLGILEGGSPEKDHWGPTGASDFSIWGDG